MNRFSMHNLYCTTPGVFLAGSDSTGECLSGQSASILGSLNVSVNSAGEFICAERCIVGFYHSFFRLVTTSTNSPLQLGLFRLKIEVSSVLFESKYENV